MKPRDDTVVLPLIWKITLTYVWGHPNSGRNVSASLNLIMMWFSPSAWPLYPGSSIWCSKRRYRVFSVEKKQVKRSPGRWSEHDGPPRCAGGRRLNEGKWIFPMSSQSTGVSVQITLHRAWWGGCLTCSGQKLLWTPQIMEIYTANREQNLLDLL